MYLNRCLGGQMRRGHIGSIVRETSLVEYFTRRLHEAARRSVPPPGDDLIWYVGNMLERFSASDRLFAFEGGRLDLRPLALLYQDAVAVEGHHERCLLLQQLGDSALFLGAMFPRYFSHRGLQRDYLVGMGGSSYDFLGANARHNTHIFAELGQRFAQVLALIAEACSRTVHAEGEERDVLALYDRWLATRDPVVGAQLTAMGIELSGNDVVH